MTLDPITREDTFRATIDELFDAFTVPHLVTRWYAQQADMDARPGGWWTFTWPPHRAASGRFITVDRPHHLVWSWDDSMQDTRRAPEGGETHPRLTMDYTFETLPNGEVRFSLNERGHDDDALRAQHSDGIDRMLEHLHDFVEKGEHVSWDMRT